MDQLVNKITFKCTDRLNETKNLEFNLKNLENDSPDSKKAYNQYLIEKLSEFQIETNQLLTEIVNRENAAIESKVLAKSQAASKANDVEEEEDEDEEDETETENNICEEEEERATKRNKDESKPTLIEDEPADKKTCL